MRIVKNETLTLYDAPHDMRVKIKKKLSIPNPLWFRLQKMGKTKALYGCPKYFRYYREDKQTGDLVLPRGLNGRIDDYVRRCGLHCGVEDQTVRPALEKTFITDIQLRDYQYGIIEEINPEENHTGIIKLSTGFGKTIIALKLIETIQTPTLIIVPKKHILKQFVDTLEHFCGVRAGVLSGSKSDIQDITVATIQTLQRREDLISSVLCRRFGAVIVDEAHGTIPEKSRGVIESFASRFRFGLTATPRRSDGQGEAIEFLYGPILVDRKLPTATPEVRLATFSGHIPVWDYHDIIKSQTENYARNQKIADIAKKEISRGRKVLVLTKRISHYESIESEIRKLYGKPQASEEADAEIFAISSRSARGETETLMGDLRSGDRPFDCLLGTFSLLSTGIDIPSLDTLIIAGDLKSDVLTEQSVGRILRLFDGKPEPRIIDIVDTGNPILKRQANERQKFYKQRNWKTTMYA